MGSTVFQGPGDAVPARAARGLQPRAPGAVRRDDRGDVAHHPRAGRRVRRPIAAPRRRGAGERAVRPRDRARRRRRQRRRPRDQPGPGHPPGHHRGVARRAAARRSSRTASCTPATARRSPTARRPCCSCRWSARPRSAITPRARIAGQTVVGVDPVTMLTGPIPATDAAARAVRSRRSTTSTSSRSTRPSRRSCSPGSTSTTRTWTG